MKLYLFPTSYIMALLTFILPIVSHPTADTAANPRDPHEPDFSIPHELICESGHSGFECFRLYRTRCGSQRQTRLTAKGPSIDSCAAKQCHYISRAPPEDPLTPRTEEKAVINTNAIAKSEPNRPRKIGYRIQVRLICDKGISAHICKKFFETRCSPQRRVVSPAYEELGSCTSKQCHCEARTLRLNFPDVKRGLDKRIMAAEDVVAKAKLAEGAEEGEDGDNDWVDVEDI